jgi:hypothetical protein
MAGTSAGAKKGWASRGKGVNPKTGKPGIKKPKWVESSNNQIPGARKSMYNKRNHHVNIALAKWANKYGGK